ncbi:hypothetical protein HDU67_008221 [Dinochytrium kinnereticum]|nr:hypothetical protein HDU67_008221 [Dinochytrium kinnereticum]
MSLRRTPRRRKSQDVEETAKIRRRNGEGDQSGSTKRRRLERWRRSGDVTGGGDHVEESHAEEEVGVEEEMKTGSGRKRGRSERWSRGERKSHTEVVNGEAAEELGGPYPLQEQQQTDGSNHEDTGYQEEDMAESHEPGMDDPQLEESEHQEEVDEEAPEDEMPADEDDEEELEDETPGHGDGGEELEDFTREEEDIGMKPRNEKDGQKAKHPLEPLVDESEQFNEEEEEDDECGEGVDDEEEYEDQANQEGMADAAEYQDEANEEDEEVDDEEEYEDQANEEGMEDAAEYQDEANEEDEEVDEDVQQEEEWEPPKQPSPNKRSNHSLESLIYKATMNLNLLHDVELTPNLVRAKITEVDKRLAVRLLGSRIERARLHLGWVGPEEAMQKDRLRVMEEEEEDGDEDDGVEEEEEDMEGIDNLEKEEELLDKLEENSCCNREMKRRVLRWMSDIPDDTSNLVCI